MLYIHSGNSLEALAEKFRLEIYSNPISDDPFRGETAVVQTGAIGEYLTSHTAERSGVAMNLDTPFFNTFITRVMDAVFSGSLKESFRRDSERFSADSMRWKLFDIISNDSERPKELDSYAISGTAQELKRWQLADKLAHDFERYALYRRETLLEWERAILPPKSWQENLYRLLHRDFHGREYYTDAFLKLQEIRFSNTLPDRVSIFGTASMPSDQLKFFHRLSDVIDVHIFHLNPCAAFWEDIRSTREDDLFERRHGFRPESYQGNPLLAASGMRGRDFFHEIMEISGSDDVCADECFKDYCDPADPPSALAAVKQDVLDMRSRGGTHQDTPELEIPLEKACVEFHSCHTRRREMEVLHDRLMALCESRMIAPTDILVTAPDISLYEPYAEAIFSRGPFAGKFSVRDRSLRRISHTAQAFMTLLAIPSGRFAFSELTDFLSNESVMRKFDFTADDVRSFTRLASAAGARWGFDAEAREHFCGVAFNEFSWRNALDRIFEGTCVEPPERVSTDYIQPVVPSASLEGEDATGFGRFASVIERMHGLSERLETPRPPREWSALLLEISEEFFSGESDSAYEIELLRRTVIDFADHAERVSFDSPIGLPVIRELLSGALDMPPDKALFTTGGITFASMIPQRSIPYRITAVLGMNEGEFPARDTRTSFELFNDVRRSDPSRTADDRFSFLQAILSAGEYILFFRDGADPVTNTDRPMAPPLAELAAVMKDSFIFKDSNGKNSRFTETRHHPQAFHQDYFAEGNRDSASLYLSFSAEAFKAVSSLAARGSGTGSDANAVPKNVIFPATAKQSVLELGELEDFYTDSCAWLARKKAGLMLRHDPDAQSDDEPFETGALDIYSIISFIAHEIGLLGHDQSPEQIRDALFSTCVNSNMLPPAHGGKRDFEQLFNYTLKLPRERLAAIASGAATADLMCEEAARGITVSGRIRFTSDNMTQTAYDAFGAYSHKHHVRMFIRTVFAAAATGRPVSCSSMFAHAPNEPDIKNHLPFTMLTPENARIYMRGLIAGFRLLGRMPTPVFEYAMAEGGKYISEGREKILAAASKAFCAKFPGIRDDYSKKWVRLCYPPDPLANPATAEIFLALCELFYSPAARPESLADGMKTAFKMKFQRTTNGAAANE